MRSGLTSNKILNFWAVGDNLLKGAALNAVQIANHLYKNDFYTTVFQKERVFLGPLSRKILKLSNWEITGEFPNYKNNINWSTSYSK